MNNEKYAIIAKNISKRYKMYKNSKEKLLDLITPKGYGSDFYALKDLSFKIEKGVSVGLIGVNGAGKSTLSNILSGVSIPTSGEIQINGQAAIIAIGSGLNNFLTGLENIEVKALMMGFNKEKIEEIKQNVIEFAEIGDFINQPIRTYSSGMRSRLGFAISIHIDPDIIVIDEALSVGDPTFTNKCLDKMNEFKAKGKTIFFVSHSAAQVKEFCDEVIWLEYGMIKDQGRVDDVLPKYQEYLNMINKMNSDERKKFKENILSKQKHNLLKEFKIIEPKYRKLKLTGKPIKYAKLVDKNSHYKVIPYNFDYKMFILGGLSSFLKHQYIYGILVLILEIITLFISPGLWGILTRFLLTFCMAFFSGKRYTYELIEKEGYIPYEIYKDEIVNKVEIGKPFVGIKQIKKQIKRENKLFAVLLTIALSSTSFVVYRHIKHIAKSNNQQDIIEVIKPYYINEKILLVIESDATPRSFSFLDISNNSIISEYYPGEVLVNYKNKVMRLDDVYIQEGHIPSEVLEGTLNKQGYTQIELDEEDIVENNISLENDIYKNILSTLIKSDNEKLLDIFKSDDKSIGKSLKLLKDNFSEGFDSKYRSQKGTYKYKSMEEITTGYIIRYYALDKDIKYYYINDIDLENYEEVRKIRELENRVQSNSVQVEEDINFEEEISGDSNQEYNINSGGSSSGGSNSGGSSSGGSNSGGSNSGGSNSEGTSGESTNPGGDNSGESANPGEDNLGESANPGEDNLGESANPGEDNSGESTNPPEDALY